MIFKNLFRQKGRTLLTIFGISIGVAAIVGLGALADGLKAGYDSILTGSKADLILSQPDAVDLTTTSIDENIGADLIAMSEISAVSGMLQGFVPAEKNPFFFVYGYPGDSFVLSRFQIIDGNALTSRQARQAQGTPLLLGAAAAEALNKNAGDMLRIMDSVFRIVGIYETGATLEDNGAVILLQDAQEVLGKPRQVSVFYIQLKDPGLQNRVVKRAARLWPDLSLSSADEFADQQVLGDYIQAAVWGIAGLAILIGGVSMMNAQLMSVVERTREIGVLRATGWSSRRVLGMIMSESLLVSFLGGVVGVLVGFGLGNVITLFTSFDINVPMEWAVIGIVFCSAVGIGFGLLPAIRASRLNPIDALRYE